MSMHPSGQIEAERGRALPCGCASCRKWQLGVGRRVPLENLPTKTQNRLPDFFWREKQEIIPPKNLPQRLYMGS